MTVPGTDLHIKVSDDRKIQLGRPGNSTALLFVEPQSLTLEEMKTANPDGKFPNPNGPVFLDREAAFQLIGYLAAFVVTEPSQ